MTSELHEAPPRASSEWRLFDEIGATLDPTEHMDVDLLLLDQVAGGEAPALRLYTWARPTLSLGRFQSDADIDSAACARAGVPVVRRPTGGAALLHGADLTYCVVMPLPDRGEGSVLRVYDLIARALIAGLRRLGVDAAIARNDGPPGPICFAGQQGADLRVGERKVCGSAQVRRRGGVLQHGSILLHRLDVDETDFAAAPCDREALRAATVTLEELSAPNDPRSVGDAIVEGFVQSLGVDFSAATLPHHRSSAGTATIVDAPRSASVAL